MKKLNGWQRLGVIASVFYVILVCLYSINDINKKYDQHTAFEFASCKIKNETASLKVEEKDLTESPSAITLKQKQALALALAQMRVDAEDALARCIRAGSSREGYKLSDRAPWLESVIISATSLPLFWCLAYAAIFLYGWVKAGFKKPVALPK